MTVIIVKQAKQYFDYASPEYVEEYDRTLVTCKCGQLYEKDMTKCDKCLELMTFKMEIVLKDMIGK